MNMNPQYPELPILHEENMLILLDEDLVNYPRGRRLTICRAAREIYHRTDDPEIKRRCKYISMLAHAITERLKQHEPEWLRNVYPRRQEFDNVMKASEE
jgi:hypothetical protein